MRLSASLVRLLRMRAPWAVALCYAFLLQAALAPVVGTTRAMVSLDPVAAILCLADQAGHAHAPDGSAHHDMGCCLPAARATLAAPALVPGEPVAIPEAPRRLAGLVHPAAPARAPPSIDLPTRPVRAPPSFLA